MAVDRNLHRTLALVEVSVHQGQPQHNLEFADFRVEEQDDGGYVGPLEWAHSYGSMFHEYGYCDCGEVLPEDWADHIKPLVPETALCRDHGNLLPCSICARG